MQGSGLAPRIGCDSPEVYSARPTRGDSLAAAEAIRLGLGDEFQMTGCPAIVGGGKRFFPEGVRLELELMEERRFDSGVIALRYAVRRN